MEDLLPELGFMNLFEKVAVIRYMNIYVLLEEGRTEVFNLIFGETHFRLASKIFIRTLGTLCTESFIAIVALSWPYIIVSRYNKVSFVS